jgi:hypothetical protein
MAEPTDDLEHEQVGTLRYACIVSRVGALARILTIANTPNLSPVPRAPAWTADAVRAVRRAAASIPQIFSLSRLFAERGVRCTPITPAEVEVATDLLPNIDD